jgi:hypothetical protein
MAMLIPANVLPAQAVAYDGTTLLEDKNPDTWAIIVGGKTGTLSYVTSGATFDFSFVASGMEAGVPYSLIYYANPYPGNFPGALIGTGTATAGGALTITGSPNLGIDLPTAPDSNMLVAHNVPPDNYVHPYGAKIWCVPSVCYNATSKSIITWSPTRFLLETDLITYTDTDKTGGTPITTTTTITEPVSTIGMTVSPTALAFGSVAIGADSAEVAITLNNTGNVPIKATATTSAGFYTDCMLFKPNGGVYSSASGWVSPTIASGASLIVYAKVHPTITYSGTVTGTLNFVASFAP